MKLIIYPLLNLRSQRAILRVRKRWGHYYSYTPRQILINRLCAELGWSEKAIREQIQKERTFLIENHKYFR